MNREKKKQSDAMTVKQTDRQDNGQTEDGRTDGYTDR
jgi:hypothetical protein